MGVLVAISIPIFSSQRKKAYLATNQANARAAYAEVTSTYLTDGLGEGTYQYNVSDGKLKMGTGDNADKPAAAADAPTDNSSTSGSQTFFSGNSTDISAWTVDSPNKVISSTTFKTWYVTIDANGTVIGYAAK